MLKFARHIANMFKHPVKGKLVKLRYDAAGNSVDSQKHWSMADSNSADAEANSSVRQTLRNDELSAIQHAMNLKFTDELAFQAEYQNEPMPDDVQEDTLLSVDEICRKLNGLPRGVVPLNCVRLTMFVDVQKPLLFFCICAWSDDFTGAVVDYGTWPDQKRLRFSWR